MEESTSFNKFELQLTETAKGFLKEVAKWAYFLSIVGYVGLGLLVLFAFFAASMFAALGSAGGAMGAMSAIGGTFITVLYLVIAVIYFFPIYYLNKFASNLKAAFREDNTETLTTSLGYLKSHYKFLGIFTVVIISIYILIFVFALVAGLGAAAM